MDSVRPGGQSSHMVGSKNQNRDDWVRLGNYVRQRRLHPTAKAAGRYYPDVRAFSAATGINERTLGKLENGHSVGGNTIAAVEIALEWAPGSARSILSGGKPTEAASAERSSGPALHDDVERKLWAALDAIDELPDEEKLLYLDIHRARKQRSVTTHVQPHGQMHGQTG